MATFLSKKGGFKAVKHLSGSPYNGQVNVYSVASGTLVPGDVVKLDGTANAKGIPTVVAATSAGSENILGAVAGIANNKLDPIFGTMSTGTISLDTPQVASAGGYVYVTDATDVIYSVEKASFAATDVGLNLDISGAAGGNAVGVSNEILGTATTGATWKVIGIDLTFQSLDPAVAGQSGYAQPAPGDTNARVLVIANNAQLNTPSTAN